MVTAFDDFGRAVGEAIGAGDGGRFVRLASTAEEALHGRFAAVVVAGLDDQRALRLRADDVAFATGAWIVPAHIDDVGLTLGPVVVPGHTACYHCFEHWRSRQAGEVDLELALASSERTASTRRGFLPPHVTLATHFVLQYVHCDTDLLPETAALVRYLWRVPELRRIEFPAEPGCLRCGRGGARIMRQLRNQPAVAGT